MHTSSIVRPAPAPRGGTETVTLDGPVLIVDRSTARPPEHDHGIEILADLTTIDGRDAGRLIRVYPRRIPLRVDADHVPRPLSRAERDQVDSLFPEPRFRVAIEHLGEYRIRDYGVPSGAGSTRTSPPTRKDTHGKPGRPRRPTAHGSTPAP